MADFNKLKDFNKGVNDAIRYGFGPKEDDQAQGFSNRYHDAATAFVDARDNEAMRGFSNVLSNRMKPVIDAYQRNPAFAFRSEEFQEAAEKASENLTGPLEDYAGRFDDDQIKARLPSDQARAEYDRALDEASDAEKTDKRKSTLIGLL